jgi:hypothetical protein
MTVVLFHAKLYELQRTVYYLKEEWAALREKAYPSLASRLDIQLNDFEALNKHIVALHQKLMRYQLSLRPGSDTWRQITSELAGLSDQVQLLRLVELPANLAITPHDQRLAELLKSIHDEVGLPNLQPVISLHQSHWFAVRPTPTDYPLYFIPATILDNTSELALVFHEIGHVIYNYWGLEFSGRVEQALGRAVLEKQRSIAREPDPLIRAELTRDFAEWQQLAYTHLEELVCDVVGALLGGPPFALALILGLLTTSNNPFLNAQVNYPPLDCRVRINLLVLRRRHQQELIYKIIDEGWKKTQNLYATSQPWWYLKFFDDQYLSFIVDAVEEALLEKRIVLFSDRSGEIREHLSLGVSEMLNALGNNTPFEVLVRHNWHPKLQTR